MGQALIKPFEVKAIKEDRYFRLYVTHTKFKGRIRKRIGDQTHSDSESLAFFVKYELAKHFTTMEKPVKLTTLSRSKLTTFSRTKLTTLAGAN